MSVQVQSGSLARSADHSTQGCILNDASKLNIVLRPERKKMPFFRGDSTVLSVKVSRLHLWAFVTWLSRCVGSVSKSQCLLLRIQVDPLIVGMHVLKLLMSFNPIMVSVILCGVGYHLRLSLSLLAAQLFWSPAPPSVLTVRCWLDVFFFLCGEIGGFLWSVNPTFAAVTLRRNAKIAPVYPCIALQDFDYDFCITECGWGEFRRFTLQLIFQDYGRCVGVTDCTLQMR